MRAASPDDTRTRLVAAATELFAARGFHATTVRQIAARAGVNVASGNYHYGSKKALYLAVLRAQFAAVRRALERRHALATPAALERLPRPALERLLRARVDTMIEVMVGAPASPTAALLHREMADPSEALPVIVEEFLRPLVTDMQAIVRRLAPGLAAAAVERCAFSIAGQVQFYRFTRPALLRLWGRDAFPPSLADDLGAHVTEFALGGIARVVARQRPRRPRGRA